jgi:hypothetical protein
LSGHPPPKREYERHGPYLRVGGEVLAAEIVIGLERQAAAPFLGHQRTLALLLDRRTAMALGAVPAGEDDGRGAAAMRPRKISVRRALSPAVADERRHREALLLPSRRVDALPEKIGADCAGQERRREVARVARYPAARRLWAAPPPFVIDDLLRMRRSRRRGQCSRPTAWLQIELLLELERIRSGDPTINR